MRVAFVVQRCGREVNGGAEALCLKIADRMAQHWETTVLTTCALDYMCWENYYPEGEESFGRTVIKRFLVDKPRDVALFNSFSTTLRQRGEKAALEDQEQWMRLQGPMSHGLLEFISDNALNYDAYIFFGYLYATTYFGLPLVRDKAWLVPLGHDEWPIYFSMWDDFFSLTCGFVFQTEEERQFLGKRFPQIDLSGPIAGVGIEPPESLDPHSFRARYGLDGPFLLYVGRIDESKGCAEMLRDFVYLRDAGLAAHELILIGPEVMTVPFHPNIIYLGVVSEEEKWNALAACEWSIAPSRYESLSLSLLESWSVGQPVLVNAESEVLVGHCRRSNGGLWYRTAQELAAILKMIDEPTREGLGRQGQRYVQTCYNWGRVEQAYFQALSAGANRT